MGQTNVVMAVSQAMTAQGMESKVSRKESKAIGGFQKLLERKSQVQSAKSDAPVEEKPKAGTASVQKEEGPVQEETSLERVKKLAEQGYGILQPPLGRLTLDGQFYEAGEYVIAWKGTSVEFIPITDLDESEMEQLRQLLDYVVNESDFSFPKTDAMPEDALVKMGKVYDAQ